MNIKTLFLYMNVDKSWEIETIYKGFLKVFLLAVALIRKGGWWEISQLFLLMHQLRQESLKVMYRVSYVDTGLISLVLALMCHEIAVISRIYSDFMELNEESVQSSQFWWIRLNHLISTYIYCNVHMFVIESQTFLLPALDPSMHI